MPNRGHQGIVGEIFRKIADYLDDKPCDVYVSPFDVRLSAEKDAADDEIINVVQPDVSVYSGGGGSYGKPAVYGPEDTFTSGVLEGFELDLSGVFS